jgi:hypothetical protein
VTSADADRFGAEIKLLAAGLRERLSQDQVAALFMGLLAYEFEEVRAALRRALSECQFFPVPKEIIGLIEDNRARARREARTAEERRRRTALPPGPADEGARETALRTLHELQESLTAKFVRPAVRPRLRSAAAMHAEVERLRRFSRNASDRTGAERAAPSEPDAAAGEGATA